VHIEGAAGAIVEKFTLTTKLFQKHVSRQYIAFSNAITTKKRTSTYEEEPTSKVFPR